MGHDFSSRALGMSYSSNVFIPLLRYSLSSMFDTL